jgi:triosephosphate isomerase
MRSTLIAGNWKMNKTVAQSTAFVRELKNTIETGKPDCDLLVIPPFLSLPVVAGELSGSGVYVGAQDLFIESNGAFTGEISAEMIVDVGATHVLVGHSERRHVLGETNEIVSKKLAAAIDAELTVILCVGEKLDEREAGQAQAVVKEQLRSALSGVDPAHWTRLVVAYEPVWAIGTGKTASPDDAQEMQGFIRGWVEETISPDISAALVIQYGGSVKPENASLLLSQPDIDGALIGGASLEVASFLGIAGGAS